MVPQGLFVDLLVLDEQRFQLFRLITRVPARQRNTLFRVNGGDLFSVKSERRRAIGQHLGHLGTRPVEHRHEVVTHDFDASRGTVADALLEVGNQAVACRFAELDVLMHRNALHHLKRQTGALDPLAEYLQLLDRPHLTDRNVVNRRHHPVHARNLPDVFQADRIGVAIPTERHFHFRFSFCRRRPIVRPRSGMR